eukprot:CAMPEP_0168229238 /NCGR_PEP_ID=MMETSP0140_2-20121125/15160_1 /TAXON_ID=44445 /ORGANISM="Pseudo-nitzschia australis, Strain 10249 10 AB" /LENGTH=225 /DNA_ID=CAMNT_0008161019 /DNA_START=74 /DNA_END=751 /DNA_ORIENTATION=-
MASSSCQDPYSTSASRQRRRTNHQRKLRRHSSCRSNQSFLLRLLPVVAVICILSSWATTYAFTSSTTSRRTRIATRRTTASATSIIKTTTRARASSTQLAIAKSGGKMIETEKQFAETVLSKDIARPVLVFYTAPWCGPCRLTVPVVKEVMKQFSGELDVVEVCTDDLAEVAEDAGVLSIPTIQFYFDGAALETHSIVGCVAKSVLSNAVEKVMEDVAQIQKINN